MHPEEQHLHLNRARGDDHHLVAEQLAQPDGIVQPAARGRQVALKRSQSAGPGQDPSPRQSRCVRAGRRQRAFDPAAALGPRANEPVVTTPARRSGATRCRHLPSTSSTSAQNADCRVPGRGAAASRSRRAHGTPARLAPARYQPLVEAGALPVFGDLKDRASLDAAVQGVDVVITTANAIAGTGADTSSRLIWREPRPDRRRASSGRATVHLHFGTRLHTDSQVAFMRAKGLAEEHLRATGMPFTILAPNFYMEVWIGAIVGRALAEGRPVTIVGEGRRKHSVVSMADVAAFALAAIGHPAATNRYLAIGGPRALSWRDVVAIHEQMLDEPSRFRP